MILRKIKHVECVLKTAGWGRISFSLATVKACSRFMVEGKAPVGRQNTLSANMRQLWKLTSGTSMPEINGGSQDGVRQPSSAVNSALKRRSRRIMAYRSNRTYVCSRWHLCYESTVSSYHRPDTRRNCSAMACPGIRHVRSLHSSVCQHLAWSLPCSRLQKQHTSQRY